jgi:hypothetical protein
MVVRKAGTGQSTARICDEAQGSNDIAGAWFTSIAQNADGSNWIDDSQNRKRAITKPDSGKSMAPLPGSLTTELPD